MIETKIIEWTPEPGMDEAAQSVAIEQEVRNQAFSGWWSGAGLKVGGKWKLIFQREQPASTGAPGTGG